jgi:HEPN domain-containing protein
VAFHCQQCAEKYLKGLMEELGLAIPRTHEFTPLLTALLPHHPSLRPLRRGLNFLNDFSVDPRYPGAKTTKRKATAALRWADRVRAEARTLLGIRPPRRRRQTSK